MKNTIRGWSTLAEILCISDTTLKTWVKKKGFPKPTYVVDGRLYVEWNLADVEKWVSDNPDAIEACRMIQVTRSLI